MVTNLVDTVLDRWWPNPEISTIEEKETLMDQKLAALALASNFTALQVKALAEGQAIITQLVQNNVVAIKSITTSFPQLGMVTADLVARSHLTGAYLDQLDVACLMKRPNVQLLYLLFKQDVILLIDQDSITPESIRLSSPRTNMLQVEFVGRRRDPTTTVVKVNAMHLWVDLMEPHAKLLEYIGPKFLVHNKTAGCIRGVQPPTSMVVTVRCSDRNYTDNRLSSWKPATETRFHTEVVEAYPFICVNCPSENVTIGQQEIECPPYPFVLDYMEPFATPTYDHSPSVMEIDMNVRLNPTELSLERIHFANLSYSTDKLSAVRKVRQLTEEVLRLNDEIAAIQLPKQTVTFRHTTWGLGTLTICLVAVLAYNCCRTADKQPARAVRRSQRSNIRAQRQRLNQLYYQVEEPTSNSLPMIQWRRN